MVVFSEPRISGRKVDSFITSLGFSSSHRVEAVGFSGGIWTAWYDTVHVEILLNHFQFIHCQVTSKRDGRSFIATTVYASPNASKRKLLWLYLNRLAPSIHDPWIIFGDFNATLTESDREGCALSTKPSTLFQSLVYDHGLRDMGFNGPEFTWSRGQAQARLDRFLCNSHWDEEFSDSSIQHLFRMRSDHQPILLQVGNSRQFPPHTHFRYFSGWNTHDDFTRMVSDNWVPSPSTVDTIVNFTQAANAWNKTVYSYIGTKKRLLAARLRGIQKSLCQRRSRFLIKLESELMIEMENLLDQEELLWKQKSRSDWVVSGDRNTRYFHRKAICRIQKNKITALKLPSGIWCTDDSELRTQAATFYHSLFTLDNMLSGNFPIQVPTTIQELINKDRLGPLYCESNIN
ncbi:hypothetical protein V6N13_017152 [Hibiscus sabdariffa]